MNTSGVSKGGLFHAHHKFLYAVVFTCDALGWGYLPTIADLHSLPGFLLTQDMVLPKITREGPCWCPWWHNLERRLASLDTQAETPIIGNFSVFTCLPVASYPSSLPGRIQTSPPPLAPTTPLPLWLIFFLFFVLDHLPMHWKQAKAWMRQLYW
jgi:hypothetical protein